MDTLGEPVLPSDPGMLRFQKMINNLPVANVSFGSDNLKGDMKDEYTKGRN